MTLEFGWMEIMEQIPTRAVLSRSGEDMFAHLNLNRTAMRNGSELHGPSQVDR